MSWIRARLVLPLACAAACGSEGLAPRLVSTDGEGVEHVRFEALPALDDPEVQWSSEILVELDTQPDPLGKPVLFDPAGLLPIGADALLVVDAAGDSTLVLIDMASGAVRWGAGRRGDGPGEIQGPVTLWLGPRGEINAVQQGSGRHLTFAPDGSLIGESRIELPEGVLLPGWVLQSPTAGAVAEHFVREETGGFIRRLFRADLVASRVDPLLELPPWVEVGQPSRGRPLWTTVPDHIVVMRSDRPRFEVHDNDGSLLRAIELPLTQRHLTASDIDEQVEAWGTIARSLSEGPVALTNALFPFTDAGFAIFHSAIYRAAEDPDIPARERRWRVLSVDGRYMGVFNPDGFEPLYWMGSDAWGVFSGEDGVPRLQLRRFRRPAALDR